LKETEKKDVSIRDIFNNALLKQGFTNSEVKKIVSGSKLIDRLNEEPIQKTTHSN